MHVSSRIGSGRCSLARLLRAAAVVAAFTRRHHIGTMKIGGARSVGLDAFMAMATATLREGVYDVKRLAAEVNTANRFLLREIATCLGVVPAVAQGMVTGADTVSTLQCFEALRERLGEVRVVMHSHQLCGLPIY